jgi:thiamine biosynthesis protein ThiS
MQIKLNGASREIATPTTVSDLLTQLDLDSRRVAVELNRNIVPRADYERVRLGEGDVLEVVHFVGGG